MTKRHLSSENKGDISGFGYRSTITVKGTFSEIKKLRSAINPELENNMFKRSTLEIKEGKSALEFVIVADDATALTATANAVLKLLCVYETSLKIK